MGKAIVVTDTTTIRVRFEPADDDGADATGRGGQVRGVATGWLAAVEADRNARLDQEIDGEDHLTQAAEAAGLDAVG